MPRHILLFSLLTALAGCATPLTGSGETVVRHVRLNEAARLEPLEVTPTAVVEDSRCPIGVHCIQAGTVRIEARSVGAHDAHRLVLPLGVPVELNGGWVSLIAVCPYPVHGSQIQPSAYLFSLAMTNADVPPATGSSGCPRG